MYSVVLVAALAATLCQWSLVLSGSSVYGIRDSTQPTGSFSELLTAYRSADADAAVTAFAAWPDARTAVDARWDPSEEWDLRDFVAYVGLHTEAAGRRGTFGRLHTVKAFSMIPDGSRYSIDSLEPFTMHAILGIESLLPRALDAPDLPVVLRDWHLLAASFHRSTSGNQDWSPIEDGRRRFGDDAQTWTAYGAVRERLLLVPWGQGFNYVGPHITGSAASDLISGNFPRAWSRNRVGDFYDRAEAQAVEAAFRRALSLDPHLGEARLRLGRTYQLIDRRREARAEFEAVLGAPYPQPRFVQYLALMFLGEIEEHEGRPALAEAHYAHAVLVVPWARSGRVALSRVQAQRGAYAKATATAGEVLQYADEGEDPFDLYYEVQRWRADELIHIIRSFARGQ